jgi:hypothetical protein
MSSICCVCWVWGIYAICFMGFRLPRPPRLVRLRPSTSLGTGSPQVARGPRNDNGVLSVCGVCCVCCVCHVLRDRSLKNDSVSTGPVPLICGRDQALIFFLNIRPYPGAGYLPYPLFCFLATK